MTNERVGYRPDTGLAEFSGGFSIIVDGEEIFRTGKAEDLMNLALFLSCPEKFTKHPGKLREIRVAVCVLEHHIKTLTDIEIQIPDLNSEK